MTKKSKMPNKVAVTWGQRPSARPVAQVGPPAADNFVQGAKGATIRLNLNIPRTLHTHVKSQCALQGRNMTDVIIELLESHFSPHSGA
jgi:hypothetical protein